MKPLKWVESNNSEEIFRINKKTDWNKRNCIYLITCDKCNKKYVGETGNKLAERVYQHKYNISKKQNSQTTIVKHFIKHNQNSMKISILESDGSWSRGQRRRAEKLWINRLGTEAPAGLNDKT